MNTLDQLKSMSKRELIDEFLKLQNHSNEHDLGEWCSGVLAPNRKIYSVRGNSTQILETDPVTHPMAIFGSRSDSNDFFGD